MKKIAITGLISSGKSSVAQLIAKKYIQFLMLIKRCIIFIKIKISKKIKFIFNLPNKISQSKNEIKKLIKQKKINLTKLEKIIHPIVRDQMKKFVYKNRKRKC